MWTWFLAGAGCGGALMWFCRKRRRSVDPEVQRFWRELSPPDRVMCELDPELRAQEFARWQKRQRHRALKAEIAAFLHDGECRVYEEVRKALREGHEHLAAKPGSGVAELNALLREIRTREAEALETLRELAKATYPRELVKQVIVEEFSS